jgi:hypothetical protein
MSTAKGNDIELYTSLKPYTDPKNLNKSSTIALATSEFDMAAIVCMVYYNGNCGCRTIKDIVYTDTNALDI